MRLAKVVHGKPSEVDTFLATRGQENTSNKKCVIIDIEEEGLFDMPALNCIWPKVQLQPGWIVCANKPDIGNRWIITGVYDDGVTMTDTDMMKIDLPAGDGKIKIGNNYINALDATQKITINGNEDILV